MNLLQTRHSPGDCSTATYKDKCNKRMEGTGLRMEDVGGMVHAFLKGTIKVGECFCTASKAKFFAKIVAAF
jgi:hypothetical protein